MMHFTAESKQLRVGSPSVKALTCLCAQVQGNAQPGPISPTHSGALSQRIMSPFLPSSQVKFSKFVWPGPSCWQMAGQFAGIQTSLNLAGGVGSFPEAHFFL